MRAVTGFLVDTRSPLAVGGGIAAALDLVGRSDDDERVAKAQRLVADRFTIQAMAQALAGVYGARRRSVRDGWSAS